MTVALAIRRLTYTTHSNPSPLVHGVLALSLLLSATGCLEPFGSTPYGKRPRRNSTAFERIALATGRWTYNSLMPVVPLVQVGLWPVLQMTLLPVLTVCLSERLRR